MNNASSSKEETATAAATAISPMTSNHRDRPTNGIIEMTKGTNQSDNLAGTSDEGTAREAAPVTSPTITNHITIAAQITAADAMISATTGATTTEKETASSTAAATTDKTSAATQDAVTSKEDAPPPATNAVLRTTDMDLNVLTMLDAFDVTTNYTSQQHATNPAKDATVRHVLHAPKIAKFFGLAGPTTTTNRAILQCEVVRHNHLLPMSRPSRGPGHRLYNSTPHIQTEE